ncbi:MAG TPA: hypothetical protein VF158_12255 [Longimicrobiales bacterium]
MRKLPWMLLLVAALAACEDPLEPLPWSDTPVKVRLWSIDRPEYMLMPSAFDFAAGTARIPEQPGASASWDVALAETADGLAFMPAGAYPGIETDPSIKPITGTSFEALLEAPGDIDTYVRSEPVPLAASGVYVVRTRRVPCGIFGATGYLYAKVRILELDPEDGTVLFEYVANANCNDRSFVPPESDG